ncbi:hypothetical protein [Chromobacterium sp. CV08]|uniref:hypothetical protein n=1 Tax=Chromobacterium sp. CV08 TaxID=3133274 RepID=UPI003DA7B516
MKDAYISAAAHIVPLVIDLPTFLGRNQTDMSALADEVVNFATLLEEKFEAAAKEKAASAKAEQDTRFMETMEKLAP